MRFEMIRTRDDLAVLTRRLGILPFFGNRVAGWSVKENIDPALWFTDREGPWEWKGQLAGAKECVYGKFIRNKAAFVSPELFPDLANWRRDGYDFDARQEDGLANYRDGLLMDYVIAHPMCLSKEAKRGCGFSKGYDGTLTRLQMQTYLIDGDFIYSRDRQGKPYGWGNAALITPEDWLGEEALRQAQSRKPTESFERIFERLRALMPDVDEKTLRRELE